MAKSLYRFPLTILLSGDLGAGKTTFVQGFAQALGIESVVSPTFALEQRFGQKLLHIDLYRLEAVQAQELLRHSDDFPGLRLIEWPEKAGKTIDAHSIRIHIEDISLQERNVTIELSDIALPTDEQIIALMDDVMLPEHIRNHAAAVASVADACAVSLIEQCRFVRPRAVHSAAMLHDILRFVDFQSLTGDMIFTPSAAQSKRWTELKNYYGQPHELAAQKYLTSKGFSAVGSIVSTHGAPRSGRPPLATTEQRILAYSDKRVAFDRIMSVDERFSDIIDRYGKDRDLQYYVQWKAEVKAIEADLFLNIKLPL